MRLNLQITFTVLLTISVVALSALAIYQTQSINAFKNLPLNRNEIILNMMNLNIDKEDLDNDNTKVRRVAEDSQLNNETLSKLSSVPIYIRGNPEILDTCHGEEISGCVTGEGIFVLQQNSPELTDYMTVVYVHEALHILHDRLNADEKKQLHSLLDKQFTSTNRGIKAVMDYYGPAYTDHWYDELHARFATEQRSLIYELENYYSKYFINRQVIVTKNTTAIGIVEDAVRRCVNTRNISICDKATSYLNSIGSKNHPTPLSYERYYGY